MKIDYEYYSNYLKDLRVKHNVNEWASWSMQTQDVKDIMARAIATEQDDREYQCYQYLFNCNKLSERDIKDIMYIHSGLFDWSSWCDETVDFVCELLAKGVNYNVLPDLEKVVDEGTMNSQFIRKCKEILDREYYSKMEMSRKEYAELQMLITQMEENTKAFPSAISEKYSKRNEKNINAVKNVNEFELSLIIKKFNYAYEQYKKAKFRLTNRLSFDQLLRTGNLPKGWEETMRDAFRKWN